jgi:hypothetical protein
MGDVEGVLGPTPDGDPQHCENNEGEASDPVPTIAPPSLFFAALIVRSPSGASFLREQPAPPRSPLPEMVRLLGLNVAKPQRTSPSRNRSPAPSDPRGRARFPHSLRNGSDFVCRGFLGACFPCRVRPQAINPAIGRAQKSPPAHSALTSRSLSVMGMRPPRLTWGSPCFRSVPPP